MVVVVVVVCRTRPGQVVERTLPAAVAHTLLAVEGNPGVGAGLQAARRRQVVPKALKYLYQPAWRW